MKSLKLLYPKAKKYMGDHKRLSDLIGKALKKITELKDKEKRKELTGDFYISCQLVKDWANGTYKQIPTGSVLKIVVGILYFIMPIDLIPDFILGTGMIDDVTVISFLLSSLKGDLDDYKKYKENDNDELEKNNLTNEEKENTIVNNVKANNNIIEKNEK